MSSKVLRFPQVRILVQCKSETCCKRAVSYYFSARFFGLLFLKDRLIESVTFFQKVIMLKIKIVCVRTRVCMCESATARLWGSEDNLLESFPPFHWERYRDEIQVIRLGGKSLKLSRHHLPRPSLLILTDMGLWISGSFPLALDDLGQILLLDHEGVKSLLLGSCWAVIGRVF